MKWNNTFQQPARLFQLGWCSGGPKIADGRAVVRLALALFGDELSPRFCFARVVAIVEWDGAIARSVGQVLLGRTPYPARLEILAEHSVTRLLCGSFPRERLVDAARFGITVHCGVSGGVPEADDELSAFIVELGLQLDAVDSSRHAEATSRLCGRSP